MLKDLVELDSLFDNDTIKLNLPDRIIRTFGYYVGIKSFEQAKKMMKEAKENAHEKNIKTAKSGKVELKKGDFVKGIQDTQYFPYMLQRGILAKDYLGGNATHDFTPLDTDVEKVIETKGTFRETLNTLITAKSFTNEEVDGKKFGKIMLVFSGDDFIETRDEKCSINQDNIELVKNDLSRKEVFNNYGSDYGIRTGIGSTKIKYIIADRYIDKLGLEIAINGFYIPIVDKDGNVIYTKEMYDEFRSKMQGLSYYDENVFTLDESAKNLGTTQIKDLIDKNEQNSRNKRDKILEALEEAVKNVGYKLSEERRLDLTPGIIEFIDTGSTGRGTNEPGDGDFDFMVRLDKILRDSSELFKNALREVLAKVKNPSETTETNAGDFRYKGVVIEGINQEIDVDLSFTERTDEIEYSTDECIKDRLSTIRSKSEEDYKYVIANILLAKKFLKQAGTYKRANAEVPKEGEVDTRGGLGGVGIENWILQNNGSFIKAAESFIKTANKYDNLEDFKLNYAIWDFGENHMSAYKDIYAHDNFVYNMNQSGYEKMKVALNKYIEFIRTEQEKVSISSLVDTSVISDTPFMQAVKAIMNKGKAMEEQQ